MFLASTYGETMKSLIAACLLVLAACGGDDGPTAPTMASIAGTWNLQTVNGSPLPFTVAQSGADKIEVLGDAITVTATATFTQLTQVRVTQGGQATTQSVADAGSYTLSGKTVTFTFNSDGSSGTGTLNGTTLTVTDSGIALVYRKQ
jgi:hypothetical protein